MAKLHEARHVTIEDLRKAGVPVHTGKEYFKSWPRPKHPVSLERIRTLMTKIPGSLAEEVARMREEKG